MKTLKMLAAIVVATLVLGLPALADDLVPPGSKVLVTPSAAGVTQVPVRYQAPVNNPVTVYDPYAYYYYGYPGCAGSYSGSYYPAPGPDVVIGPGGYPVLRSYEIYVSPAEARWRR
ncbi:MAG: hypothetical protein HY319_20690 [Armatimonadetes bacterium]|nr:hypothetical protein [Armatimonadota bacterium]